MTQFNKFSLAMNETKKICAFKRKRANKGWPSNTVRSSFNNNNIYPKHFILNNKGFGEILLNYIVTHVVYTLFFRRTLSRMCHGRTTPCLNQRNKTRANR